MNLFPTQFERSNRRKIMRICIPSSHTSHPHVNDSQTIQMEEANTENNKDLHVREDRDPSDLQFLPCLSTVPNFFPVYPPRSSRR